MSTIQNQTVLFVPHLDPCVKASNTLARQLKHNFKHQKIVYVSRRSEGVRPESCSLVQDFKNPAIPGISVVAKKIKCLLRVFC